MYINQAGPRVCNAVGYTAPFKPATATPIVEVAIILICAYLSSFKLAGAKPQQFSDTADTGKVEMENRGLLFKKNLLHAAHLI